MCLSDRGSGDAPNRGVSHCHRKPFKARKAKARTPTKHQPRGAMSPCPTRVPGRALSFREPNHVNPVLRRALAVEPQHVIPGQAKAADGWRPLPNSDAVGEKRGCQTRGSRSETVEEGVERKHRLHGGIRPAVLPPTSLIKRCAVEQNESPHGCARRGLSVRGTGHLGGWGRGPQTQCNARSALVFPCRKSALRHACSFVGTPARIPHSQKPRLFSSS
jgi:hypothetical protein